MSPWGGILFAVEPKYGINDRIDVGLRIEIAAMARSVEVNNSVSTGTAQAAGSYVLTGNYMLSENNFRPFVGVGLGLFGTASSEFVATSSRSANGSVAAGNVLGGMVRGGFKAGHFVLALEYNIVPNSSSLLLDSKGTAQVGKTAQSQNSYLSIKLGIDIGGGRR